MNQKSCPEKKPAEQVIKGIRRQTRRHHSAEEKIRIVLEGLRGEECIPELCRRKGTAASMCYGWWKSSLRLESDGWLATRTMALQWVDWFNNRRLPEPVGNIPPAKAEANDYAAQ